MAGFMDFLRNNNGALLQTGLGLLGGQNAQQQAALGAQGLSNALNQNKTVAYLEKSYPDLAEAVKTGSLSAGDAWKLAYTQKLEAAKPKNNFITAGKNLYNAETGEWVSPPAGLSTGDEEWGLNPVWGKDANGKTVLGQVSKAGKFKPLDTGDFQPTPVLQNIDTGTAVLSRNSRTGEVVAETPKDLAGAEEQKLAGKGRGEALATYESMSSKMPNLEATVQGLDGLAQKATYTLSGQLIDSGMRQAGMEPREAAVARAEYVAMIDNQVLPLLRDTFGAQFTQAEGERLRATLGDVDKSPKEKQAVLRAFIEQKRRTVEDLARQSGQSGAPGGVVDYSDYFKQ